MARAGARRVAEYDEKKQAVVEHISSFYTCRASHYARRGAPGRTNLQSDLSIARMHQLFKEQNHAQVSYSLYYSVFCYKFNLGFGHPVKDVSATCISHKHKLKDPDITDAEKPREAAMFMLHRRQARLFYDQLNDVGTSLTVCFDMMENMVLPKMPGGQSYYSRQLYLYLFGVIVHRGRGSEQAYRDIHLYVWGEHENKKGSNIIASALFHCFNTVLVERINEVQDLRLFSNSCYGQNKNMSVITMLFEICNELFPRLNIEYTYPVQGHSFLPANRAFGRIGQDLKKDTLLVPEEYYKVLRKHGNLYTYGQDWQSYDYKATASSFLKSKRSSKLSEAKVVRVNGSQLALKSLYNAEFTYHSVLKWGKIWLDFDPPQLLKTSAVKEVKKVDVRKLLDAIAAPANVRHFYDQAFANLADRSDSSGDSDDREE